MTQVNQTTLVYTTFATLDEAQQIGKTLVSEKLIACINIFPGMTSIYEWQGNIESASEVAALLKSHKDLENDIIERLKQLHSYDTAAILVVDVQASSSEFQDWILQQTRSS